MSETRVDYSGDDLENPEKGWEPDVWNPAFQTRSNRFPAPHSRVTPHPVTDQPSVKDAWEAYLKAVTAAHAACKIESEAFERWQHVSDAAHSAVDWETDKPIGKAPRLIYADAPIDTSWLADVAKGWER